MMMMIVMMMMMMMIYTGIVLAFQGLKRFQRLCNPPPPPPPPTPPKTKTKERKKKERNSAINGDQEISCVKLTNSGHSCSCVDR